jgi:hypothetical protein
LKAVSLCFTNWFYDKYPLKNIALTPLLAMQAMWDLMFSVQGGGIFYYWEPDLKQQDLTDLELY